MIRHEYETIYVTRPDLEEADQNRIDEKLKGIVTNGDGDLLVFEQWGKRKLAYPIRRHLQGSYQFLQYVAPPELPFELERNMNLEDMLIRFITVKLDENVDVEAARTAAVEATERRIARLGVEADDEDEGDADSDTSNDDANDGEEG